MSVQKRRQSALRQTLFHFIERVENFFTRSFVSPLARGEAGPVNSVVDVVVKKLGELDVFGFDILREKIDVFVFGELVEDAVEHGTDVILAIVHDLFSFLVPKCRNSHPFFEIRIGRGVGLTQVMEAVHRIGRFELVEFVQRRAGPVAFRVAEGPAFLVAKRIDDRHADRVFEAF